MWNNSFVVHSKLIIVLLFDIIKNFVWIAVYQLLSQNSPQKINGYYRNKIYCSKNMYSDTDYKAQKIKNQINYNNTGTHTRIPCVVWPSSCSELLSTN